MQTVSPSHVTTHTYENPLGRASMQRPTPVQLERASVVRLPRRVVHPTRVEAGCGHIRGSVEA